MCMRSETDHICHAQYSNYNVQCSHPQHNSLLCTSTCTALPITLSSTTLLCPVNMHSPVPRPSYQPVFDILQYAKDCPFYHVNNISVYLGRQRWEGVPDRKDAFHTRILRFEPRVVHFSLCEHLKLQCLGQKLHDQVSCSTGDPSPLCLPR